MGGLDYGDEDDECEEEDEDMVMEKKSVQKESYNICYHSLEVKR